MTRERLKRNKQSQGTSDFLEASLSNASLGQEASATPAETPLNAPKPKSTTTATSKQATESLIRRTLCAHRIHTGAHGNGRPTPPIDQLLPPLTSSNEVDLELYAFIAILIKDFVQPWYGKITSDHVFVDEIIQTVAHCTLALEQRVRAVDLELLVLEDIADLFDAHVTVLRLAQQSVQDPSSQTSIRAVYHTLRPHPALAPVPDQKQPGTTSEQAENDSAYRNLLAQGLLAVLLPTEDLQNPCLRALVSEVAADLVLGQFLSERLCDGAFIYDSIARACSVIQPHIGTKRWAFEREVRPTNKLHAHGLLESKDPVSNHPRSFKEFFWELYGLAVLGITILRTLMVAFATSFMLPRRELGTPAASIKPAGTGFEDTPLIPRLSTRKPVIDYKIWAAGENLVGLALRMPWLKGSASLLHHLLITGPGRWGAFDGRLDRLLAYHVVAPLLSPSRLPLALRNLRAALCPGNTVPRPAVAALRPSAADGQQKPNVAPAPPASATAAVETRPHKDDDDAASRAAREASKHRAALALLNLVPRPLARVYFGAPPRPRRSAALAGNEARAAAAADKADASRQEGAGPRAASTATAAAAGGREAGADADADADEEALVKHFVAGIMGILAVFDDSYMNRHLLYAVLELVVARVVPELSSEALGGEGKGVEELLADRGVVF